LESPRPGLATRAAGRRGTIAFGVCDRRAATRTLLAWLRARVCRSGRLVGLSNAMRRAIWERAAGRRWRRRPVASTRPCSGAGGTCWTLPRQVGHQELLAVWERARLGASSSS